MIDLKNIDRIIAGATGAVGNGTFRLLVLGSGMGRLISRNEYLLSHQIADQTTQGHPMSAGVLPLARGVTVVLAGRSHNYESSGSTGDPTVLERFLLAGPSDVLLLSAVGGLAPGLRVGDLVGHTDYLAPLPSRNYTGRGRAGRRAGPGVGGYSVPQQRLEDLGERARRVGVRLRQGVYAWVTGPSYETRAEIGMLRSGGGDIVGMSAYPEIVSCFGESIPALGVSLVTNRLSDTLRVGLDHLEVTTASGAASGNIRKLIHCW